ncbi:MAG: polysaccharide biosynthesis tyrosine autokinase [Lentisphaeria bacterium]|nr:polysaccharide biosynthesis tyrosine autokinase [Lentisphaeria bacterium]
MENDADNANLSITPTVIAKGILYYWWVILPLLSIGAISGYYFSEYLPRRYSASCRYEVFENNPLKKNQRPFFTKNQSSPLDRHILLLRGGVVNSKVRSEFDVKLPSNLPNFMRMPYFILKVSPVMGSDDTMMDISVSSFSEEDSLKYLTLLVAEYQKQLENENDTKSSISERVLLEEKEDVENNLSRIQSEINKFRVTHNMSYNEQKKDSDISHLSKILARIRDIQTEKNILDEQFPFLESKDAATLRDVLDLTMSSRQGVQQTGSSSVTGVSSNSNVTLLWKNKEADILKMKSEYEYLSQTFKPAHPKMKNLLHKIKTSERELEIEAELSLKRLKSRRDALEMQEKSLIEAANLVKNSVDLSTTDRVQYENLLAEEKRLKTKYNKVFDTLLSLTSVSQNKYFSRFVRDPSASSYPVWPHSRTYISKGALAGGAIAVLIVLLSYGHNLRMHNYARISSGDDLNLISVIPKVSKKIHQKNPLFISSLNKSSLICEVYRSLKATLIQKTSDNAQCFLFTSPNPADGKTFTTINIASVFSWQKEKTLIVDGDFRKFTMRKAFPDASKQGVLEVLQGKALLNDVIVRNVSANLDYLPAGFNGNQVTEYLQDERFKDLLDELKSQYRFIIFDSAPVNHIVDTVLMSKHMDGVVIIAQSGKTHPDEIIVANNRLEETPIIGYILNHVSPSSEKYSRYVGGGLEYGMKKYYGRADGYGE